MSSVYFCCLKKNKLDRDFLYYQISSLVGPLRNHVWSLFPINRKRMQRGLLRATCSLPFPWEENVAQGKRAGLDCQGTSKRGLVKWSMDGETMNIRCNTVISWKKNSCSVTSNYETSWRTITSVRCFNVYKSALPGILWRNQCPFSFICHMCQNLKLTSSIEILNRTKWPFLLSLLKYLY